MARGVMTLQREVEELRREILSLKVACAIPAQLEFYTWSADAPPSFQCEITYGEGNQPVITEIYYGGELTMTQPVGNKQKIYMYASGAYAITIVSTRPILSVRAI